MGLGAKPAHECDRLRELDLGPGNPPSPILMSMTPDAQRLMDEFGSEMEARLDQAGGLLRSAFGKARGAALRLSLVLEWLWCCAKADMSLPPDSISKKAFAPAATLVSEYYMPMAERVFSDAGATDVERDAATLTRWILKERPDEVHGLLERALTDCAPAGLDRQNAADVMGAGPLSGRPFAMRFLVAE